MKKGDVVYQDSGGNRYVVEAVGRDLIVVLWVESDGTLGPFELHGRVPLRQSHEPNFTHENVGWHYMQERGHGPKERDRLVAMLRLPTTEFHEHFL